MALLVAAFFLASGVNCSSAARFSVLGIPKMAAAFWVMLMLKRGFFTPGAAALVASFIRSVSGSPSAARFAGRGAR
jgi:hypothetical protein